VFAVVAVVAFVIEVSSSDPTAPGVGAAASLVLLAVFAGRGAPGPLRSACVSTIVLGVPIVWLFAFAGGGNGDGTEIRGLLLLTLLSYASLYLVGWTRGRAVLLAGALIVLASWLGFEVAGSNSTAVVPFQDRISSPSASNRLRLGSASSFSTGPGTNTEKADDASDSTAAVSLVLGLGFLGAGAALDRRRLDGAATPFVAVGAIETILGAVILGADTSVAAGGVAAVLAGGAVGLVATRGRGRRATTWTAVLTVFGGLVAVLAAVSPDDPAGVGGIALVFAIILGWVAWRLAPRLGEPDDGDDRDPVSPPPPPAAGAAPAPRVPRPMSRTRGALPGPGR
jgi:hypothetical protein